VQKSYPELVNFTPLAIHYKKQDGGSRHTLISSWSERWIWHRM